MASRIYRNICPSFRLKRRIRWRLFRRQKISARRIPAGMSISTCCFVKTVDMQINTAKSSEKSLMKSGTLRSSDKHRKQNQLSRQWIDGKGSSARRFCR